LSSDSAAKISLDSSSTFIVVTLLFNSVAYLLCVYFVQIDSGSGRVTLRGGLDRETAPRLHVTVSARDSGSPPLSGTAALTVAVRDVNDNPPVFRRPDGYSFRVLRPVPLGARVGAVQANDSDAAGSENSRIVYFLRAGRLADLFDVTAATGEIRTKVRIVILFTYLLCYLRQF